MLGLIQRDLDGPVFLSQAFLDQAHEVQVVEFFKHGFITVGGH